MLPYARRTKDRPAARTPGATQYVVGAPHYLPASKMACQSKSHRENIMSDTLQLLIERQQARLHALREDTLDIAATIADEVWDRFELDIEEVTEDGYMFDLAKGTQISLACLLAMHYDDAFERHVLGFFEQQQQALQVLTGPLAAHSGTTPDLAGLRKGLKLRRHANALIGQAIARAKPSLIGSLLLCSDPTSAAWDRELQDNARRLRSRLLALRTPLSDHIREESQTLLQAARLAYIRLLDELPNRHHATHTHRIDMNSPH